MRTPALFCCASLAVLALAACGGGERTPVPRRHAYPRMAVPAGTALDTLVDGLRFRGVIHGSPTLPRPDWLDIAYPGAVLHLAVRRVEPAQLQTELADRRQRLSLNIGGAPARTEHLTSADGRLEYVIVTSETPVLTPVQLLGTDGRGTIVSGALELSAVPPPAATDSLAPLLHLVTDDLKNIL